MCRVLLATGEMIKRYQQAHGLRKLLEFLERQCGGHGNGVSIFEKKKEKEWFINSFSKKGVEYSINDAYMDIVSRILINKERTIVMFHTRITSMGATRDDQCHPFWYEGGSGGCLIHAAMNGTIMELGDICRTTGENDSQVLCRLAATHDPKMAKAILRNSEQVWVAMINGFPYVSKGTGCLTEWWTKKQDKDDFFFVSSLPMYAATKGERLLGYRFQYDNGERTMMEKPVVSSWTHTGYSYPYSTYERHRWDTVDEDEFEYKEISYSSKEKEIKIIGRDTEYLEGYRIGLEEAIDEIKETEERIENLRMDAEFDKDAASTQYEKGYWDGYLSGLKEGRTEKKFGL